MKKLFICFFVVALIIEVKSYSEESFFLTGIRPMGMGGAFVAVADDQNMFFYNPAGFGRVFGKDTNKSMTCVFDLYGNVDQGTYTILRMLPSTVTSLTDTMKSAASGGKISIPQSVFDLMTELQKNPITLETYVPLLFNLCYYRKYFGIGIFNKLTNQTGIKEGMLILNKSIDPDDGFYWDFRYDLATYISGGIDLPYETYLGASIKLIDKNKFSNAIYLPELLGLIMSSAGKNEDASKQFMSKFTTIQNGATAGFDVGGLCDIGDFSIGFIVKDVYAFPIQYRSKNILTDKIGIILNPFVGELAGDRQSIPMNVRVGVAYKPTMPAVIRFMIGEHDLIFAIDVDDVIARKNFFTKLYIGAELKLFGVASLRGGLAQGYPTGGLGIHIFVVDLEYAYFGKELGSYPGSKMYASHAVSLAARF